MMGLVFTMLFPVLVNILLPSPNPYAFMLMAVFMKKIAIYF